MGGLRTLITFAALVNVFVLSWWMTRGSISVTIQAPLPATLPPVEGGVDGAQTPQGGTNSSAFLTLCTNLKMLPGVMVQISLLQKFGTRYPILVMVTSSLPLWAQQVLAILGAELVQAERIPFNFRTGGGNRGKWSEAVVKLRMFDMAAYARLVYLDADVLVQGNVDHLFQLPFASHMTLYGSQDLHDCDLVNIGLNSGVLVLQPNRAAFTLLMENYKSAPFKTQWHGDQDLIFDTFKGSTQFLPESTVTMMVQCACPILCTTCPKKNLKDSRLVHGASFLPIDVMSHYGAAKGNLTKGGFMPCASEQYEAWEKAYLETCDVFEKLPRSGLIGKLRRAEFCDLKPYPGKDAAWRKIKEMERVHEALQKEG